MSIYLSIYIYIRGREGVCVFGGVCTVLLAQCNGDNCIMCIELWNSVLYYISNWIYIIQCKLLEHSFFIGS